jgi:hypothetical protein
MVTIADDRVLVTARGFSPAELRRYATRECEKALGHGCWCFTQADVRPCMVSLGGRARLFEGHFVATSTS